MGSERCPEPARAAVSRRPGPTGIDAARPGRTSGPSTAAGVQSLQRLAGNRAVTQFLQRQAAPPSTAPTPAPAPQSSAPAGTTSVPSENGPVRLPPAGGLSFTLSAGRQINFTVNDLREFGLGEGVLQTPEIPVGEFLSAKAAIGSHNPITLTQPSLTLDPVIASISAAEVARGQPDTESRRTVGAVAAAAGGISGGLQGLVGGALLGGLALGPAGAGAGGVLGARWGAEQGGLAAGRAAEWLYDKVSGDIELTARLDQGQIHGDLGLHYTPFVRLSLAATGLDWLARIGAELQTAMSLTARTTISLGGSVIRLRFRAGELVRSEFTLAPSVALGVDLDAQARLRLTGSFLNILKESVGRDDSVITGEYVTPSGPLFHIGGSIGAQTSFTFSKGSPLEVLGRQVTAAAGATRERFIAGLRVAGPNIPLLQQRAPLDAKSRTGLNPGDAVVMQWHKPAHWYPLRLTRPSPSGRGQAIALFPHRTYDNGFSAGVDRWPSVGMKLPYRGGEEPRGNGVARFIRELREEGIELDYDLAYKADIDHVVDWAFGGADDETNLWPLESGANRSAGVTQNRLQQVWWAEQRGAEPRRTRIENVPTGRFFEIGVIRSPR